MLKAIVTSPTMLNTSSKNENVLDSAAELAIMQFHPLDCS
jgi:hypothetical protein